MKRLSIIRPASVALCAALATSAAQAAEVINIDFSGVPLFTQDPVIQGVSFVAGAAADFADTITDDSATPGNPALLAGLDDSPTNYTPFNTTAFIGAALSSVLGSATDTTTIDLSASFLSPLPTGATILAEALLGGVVQGSDSFTTSGTTALPLRVVLNALAFDALHVYVPANFGSVFLIDDLRVDVTSNGPGPGPGPNPAPAPATLLLLGLGAVAMRLSRLMNRVA